MILANARQCLSREDAQLAVRLVAHESIDELERAQQRLVDEGRATPVMAVVFGVSSLHGLARLKASQPDPG